MRIFKKFFTIAIAIFLVLTNFGLSYPIDINAKGIPSIITDLKLTDNNGNDLNTSVGEWDNFQIQATFKLPNNQIVEGDTTVIKLPNELEFTNSMNLDIKDDKGYTVAVATIDSKSKTITLTYTDYPQKYSDVTGKFYFYVKVDKTVVQKAEKIPVNLDIEGEVKYVGDVDYKGVDQDVTETLLIKSGEVASRDNKNFAQFHISVNRSKSTYKNVVVHDEMINVGVILDETSFEILKGTWDSSSGNWKLLNPVNVTSQYKITISEDKTKFSIDFGDLNPEDGFRINYAALINYKPVDGEKFRNKVSLSSEDVKITDTYATATYYEGGGSAEGYLYGININKVDEENNALSGAEFEVTRDSTGEVVGKIIVGSDGKGSITKLLKDNFTIRETKAPEGYDILSEVIKVKASDFDSSKVITLDVVNHKKTIEVRGVKTWNDGNDQDGIRPDKITVILKADGTEVDRLEVTEADGWSYAFTNLPKLNGGNEITYTVEELAVPGYDPVVTGYDIENKHTPATIEVRGVKTWNDSNNQDGIRPDKITVILKADGTEVDRLEVTEADGWNYVFTNLPKLNGGNEITYTVEEVTVPGYDPVVTGYDIENKHTPATIEVRGVKTWNDSNNQDGIRPDKITVILKADGTEVDRLEVTEADGWNYVFTNLPKLNGGNEITYTVEEVTVPGYDPVITGYDIENKHTPATIEVRGVKTWNDNNDQDGIRPEKITVILKADGTEVDRLDVTEADGWNYAFTNLPLNKDGKEITYTVEEVAVPGYDPVITGYDIENKHTPATIEVRGVKTWNDGNNQDGIRPDKITVILKADGTEVDRVEVTEADGWNYAFTNLPKLKNGKEITYTVEEVAVPGYDSVITGYDIENTHIPATIEVRGVKTWNDSNNQDGIRPDKITVILKADGTEVKRLEVTEADGWSYAFTNLPFNKGGKEIIYTVEELAVPGYESVITAYDIENKHVPGSVEISGTKTWNDGNNQDGLRPDTITVILMADGVEVKRLEVTEADGWSYAFTNLPLNKNGKEIIYTIEEVAVPGYETVISELNIENVHTPSVVVIEGIKTWVDNNNVEGKRPDSITVRLWADGIEIINAKPIWTKSGNEWKYTFIDMPEYQDGKRIVYSVTEDSVKGYETKITNLDIENTLIPQLPSTGQNNNYLGYLLMILGAAIVAISRKNPEERSNR